MGDVYKVEGTFTWDEQDLSLGDGPRPVGEGSPDLGQCETVCVRVGVERRFLDCWHESSVEKVVADSPEIKEVDNRTGGW